MKVKSKTDQNLINHCNYDGYDYDDGGGDSCNSKVNAAYLYYVFLYNILPMRDFSFPSRIR
jgi:hypothetical protein